MPRSVSASAAPLRCVVLLALVGGLSGCDSTGRTTARTEPMTATYYASEWGVRVGVQVGFPERRRVSGARLVWEGGAQEVPLYPLDGTDPEPPPETLDLPEGVKVLLEGSVVAACPESPSLPVFEVQTLVGGKRVTERYTPDDESKFANAFAEWCDLPFMMTLTGSESTAQGDNTFWLSLHNPGPLPVSVVSEAVTRPGWTWELSGVVVPAGTIRQLTIRGHGAMAVAPWETGNVLANGRPIKPNGDGG